MVRQNVVRGVRWLRALAALAVIALAAVATLARPVAAHGARTGGHGHTLPIVAFLLSATVLGASLVADHLGAVDRSLADVGVIAGGIGIVLSVGLLWL